MKNKLILAGILIIGLVLVLIWIAGGFHSKVPGGRSVQPAKRDSSLRTMKVEMTRLPGQVTVSGTVIARETARVAAKVHGYVVQIKADAGDSVKKGDELLRLDSKELIERQAQARAALAGGSADLTRTKADYDRFKGLYEKQTISKKQFDDATAAYDVAAAAEVRAKAALDEAETLLSYTVIRAPFDGVIGERAVNVGDLVASGRFLLSVFSPGSAEMEAPIAEQYVSYLKVGTPIIVEVPSIRFKQNVKITEVVPQRDERTRTIRVKAALSESLGLAPGLYGKMTFDTKESEVIMIPRAVVKSVGQLETVRVLEGGVVNVRHVKTGRAVDDKVEVLSGIRAGEDLVLE